MKVETSQVKKLLITGAKLPEGLGTLDPISVIVENFGPGAGKITITCFGEAWSNYWGCMDEQHTLESFFCKADKHYIAGKLKNGIEDRIKDDDPDTIEKALKREIVKSRRNDEMSKSEARDAWNNSEHYADAIAYGNIGDGESDLLYAVFGDEWWYRLPKKPNPDYEYLCNIIEAVKEALKGE